MRSIEATPYDVKPYVLFHVSSCVCVVCVSAAHSADVYIITVMSM